MWAFQKYYDVIKSVLEGKTCTFADRVKHLVVASMNPCGLERNLGVNLPFYFSTVCPLYIHSCLYVYISVI